jgi:hypothetical protein
MNNTAFRMPTYKYSSKKEKNHVSHVIPGVFTGPNFSKND